LFFPRYTEEIIKNFRFIIIYAIAISTFVLLLCGLIILMNVSVIVKLQFVILSATALTEIYVYAWPANHVMDMSTYVSQSAYELRWYDLTLEMQKDLLIVLAFQKPVVVSVPCILPELSLRYYCSYLSNAFSIFTAVRVFLGNNDS
ncbi:PREDICTED: uncharacterized protein LOC108545757, partial [Eufriesea mexicana]|uniref:uncharacterized protein LOC108545757 n=1 Tax=Eufriesea mexicana TaxID=516756 RepID=UPI00083BAA1F